MLIFAHYIADNNTKTHLYEQIKIPYCDAAVWSLHHVYDHIVLEF